MKRFSLIILSCLTVAWLWSCSSTPDGILPKEEMAQMMADIHIGESVVEANQGSFRTDSAKRAFRQAIYQRHGLTTEQAEESLRWYGYNMEKYMEVYDRVLEILDQRMRDAELLAGTSAQASNPVDQSLSLEGDSVDVWSGVRFRPFASTLSSNMTPFHFLHDPFWEKGDVYYLRSKMIGNSMPVQLTVAIDYDDGSKEVFSNRMIGDGWHEVSFGLDSLKSARQIYGALSYNAPVGETAFIDSISFTRTRWMPGRPSPRGDINPLRSKRHSSSVD